MKEQTDSASHHEQLHQMYYSLAYKVLPDLLWNPGASVNIFREPFLPLITLNEATDSEQGNTGRNDLFLSEKTSPNLPGSANEEPFTSPGKDHGEDFANLWGEEDIPGSGDLQEEIDFLSSIWEEEAETANTATPVETSGQFPEDEKTGHTAFDAFNYEKWAEELLADEAELPGEVDAAVKKLLAGLDEEQAIALSFDQLSEEEILQESWVEAWYYSDLADIPSREGYSMERIQTEEVNILLFCFPEPFRMPGCWAASAICRPGTPYRYFTLEKSYSYSEPEGEAAMLCEWTHEKRHHNYGEFHGDIRNKEDFLMAALKVFSRKPF